MNRMDFASARLVGLSPVISQYIPLRREGHEWVSSCPFHQENTPSFKVNDAKGFAHCFGCQWHGDGIDFVSAFKRIGLWEAAQRLCNSQTLPSLKPLTSARGSQNDTTRAAKKLWLNAASINGTAGEAYLLSRGINMPLSDSLRFARLLHPTGRIYPAVVALVVKPDGDIAGVQRIFVAEDGRGKAKVPTPKLSLGRIAGNAVRLGPPEKEVIIVEGLEDALSVQQAVGTVTWASAGASMMSKMTFPPAVRSIVIGQDNDPAGDREAAKAAVAFTKRGLLVRMAHPDVQFKDWNEQLIVGGATP